MSRRELRLVLTACCSRTAAHGVLESLARSRRYAADWWGFDVVEREAVDPQIARYTRCAGPDELAARIAALRATWQPHGVIALIEEDLAALIREPATRDLVVGPRDQLPLLLDKLATFERLGPVLAPAALGGTGPAELTDHAERLGYPDRPLILKPRSGRGARGVLLIAARPVAEVAGWQPPRYSAASATEVVEPGSEWLLMEHLDGVDYTVFCLAERGALRLCVPLRRERFSPGITWAGRIERQPAITAYCAELAGALSLDGFANVQLRVAARGPVLYEINPRYSGSTRVAVEAGVNFAEAMLDHHLGEPIPEQLEAREVRFWRDVRERYSV